MLNSGERLVEERWAAREGEYPRECCVPFHRAHRGRGGGGAVVVESTFRERFRGRGRAASRMSSPPNKRAPEAPRGAGLAVVGNYHSHPNTQPYRRVLTETRAVADDVINRSLSARGERVDFRSWSLKRRSSFVEENLRSKQRARKPQPTREQGKIERGRALRRACRPFRGRTGGDASRRNGGRNSNGSTVFIRPR